MKLAALLILAVALGALLPACNLAHLPQTSKQPLQSRHKCSVLSCVISMLA